MTEFLCKICNLPHPTGACQEMSSFEINPFTAVLDSLDFQPQPSELSHYTVEKAVESLDYNGFEIQVVGTDTRFLSLDYRDIVFQLFYRDREFLYTQIMSSPENFFHNQVFEPKLVTGTSIVRTGKKRDVPLEFAGIGLKLYCALIEYNQKIANEEHSPVYHFVRPMPSDQGDWGLVDQAGWNRKFEPLLLLQGYTPKQMVDVIDPKTKRKVGIGYPDEVDVSRQVNPRLVFEKVYIPLEYKKSQ